MKRIAVSSLALMLVSIAPGAAQRPVPHATVVYGVGKEPAMPVPLFTGNEEANEDLADQLFLHLAVFAANGRGTGDAAFAPALAKSWRRTDPLTLVFDLDPRARWHDGAPVTAHDVVFTWNLANNPKVAADRARLDPIASVEAVGDRAVRVRFKRPSAEQVYTFGFLMQPLPSHLLEKMAPEAIPASDYAKHPVGNGPFRFERRIPAQAVELRADTAFFLGRPGIYRVLFRLATDPAARLQLFLSGDTDILDKIPAEALPQVRQHAGGTLLDLPSNTLYYFLFNPKMAGDSAKAHPVFADVRVREALTLALDRETMAHTTFGASASVPDAAQSQIWGWITPGGIRGTPPNAGKARALLAQAGWRDANGDGILDRNGLPLHFSVTYAASSGPANTLALQAQQMWKMVGADVTLDKIEGSVIPNRLASGQWELLVRRVGEDPTPSSLVQSWSCESAHQPRGTNYAHWCDPVFDSLVAKATAAKDPPAAWRAVFARMTAQRPAIFLAAPANQIAVHRRLENVITWPSHTWLSLWQWRVRPAAALARDQ